MSTYIVTGPTSSTEGQNITLNVTRQGDLSQAAYLRASTVAWGNYSPALQMTDTGDQQQFSGRYVYFAPGVAQQTVSYQTYSDGKPEEWEYSFVSFDSIDYYGSDRFTYRSGDTIQTNMGSKIWGTKVYDPGLEPIQTPVYNPVTVPVETPTYTVTFLDSDIRVKEGEGFVIRATVDKAFTKDTTLSLTPQLPSTGYADFSDMVQLPNSNNSSFPAPLVFRAGQTYAEAIYRTLDDNLVEGTESFNVYSAGVAEQTTTSEGKLSWRMLMPAEAGFNLKTVGKPNITIEDNDFAPAQNATTNSNYGVGNSIATYSVNGNNNWVNTGTVNNITTNNTVNNNYVNNVNSNNGNTFTNSGNTGSYNTSNQNSFNDTATGSYNTDNSVTSYDLDYLLNANDYSIAKTITGNGRLNGTADNDLLTGGKRNDKIYGGEGNDELIGNLGKDKMYGGGGSNIFDAGTSSSKKDADRLYLQWEEDAASADIIQAIGKSDRIYIQGAVGDLTVKGIDGGLGIYDNDVLQAIYTGNNFNASTLTNQLAAA